ncbi:hypothetical protein DH2020_027722 [Rehmannia glutinosa]|uniref:Uncharacterized protein n=1 Tax=Rehmannia glutinosa TaxID=99300 RepID=A0ABR0VTD6_REHGL
MDEHGQNVEPKMTETELRENGGPQCEELPSSVQKSIKCSVRKKKSLRARYAYGVIFLLTNIIAWLFRDYGERILPMLPYSKACGAEERECELARVGAGCSIGLFMSTVFYISSVCGIVVMYVFYASKTSCSLNIFFISWTGVLLIVMMVISLHSKVNRGLLSSGIMASYIVFLCWTAMRSEPGSEKCSPEKQESGHIGWSAIVGFVIALCAIVIATFSTGIDSQSFQFRKDKAQLLEDDIPYSYGFFHLVFSLGAMYFAMLFISWNLGSLTRMWKLIFPVLKETKVMNHEETIEEMDKREDATPSPARVVLTPEEYTRMMEANRKLVELMAREELAVELAAKLEEAKTNLNECINAVNKETNITLSHVDNLKILLSESPN